ncbi:hypothetical protein LJC58_05455 [Lachnospiraceae bacterium OttesenSCG-928-D06]|nr:hypothetical protein [Lachnospiraceae bacterium OttesenSCG-928-D06]
MNKFKKILKKTIILLGFIFIFASVPSGEGVAISTFGMIATDGIDIN